MPLITGLIIGGATLATGIAGDITSSMGQEDANATNLAIHQGDNNAALQRQEEAEAFNNEQAQISRQFSAQQVAQQEAFQQGTMKQAEAYDTEMSNTAMQRRVADLKAAGINPLLAVSQGGASAPTISGMPGGIGPSAQASIGPAGAPGAIPMANTGAAFGNLGGQMSSALEASKSAASIDLLKAQADKAHAEADTQIPAQVDYLKSMTGLTTTQANQAYYQTMNIQEQIYGQRLTNDQLRDILTPLKSVDLQVAQATRDALISARTSDATAKQLNLQGLRNLNEVEQGNFGQIIAFLNAILQPLHTASQIVN